MVEYLVGSGGADPSALSHPLDRTPLSQAAKHDREDVVRYLAAEAGADVDHRDKDRATPLMLAVLEDSAKTARWEERDLACQT